MRPRVGYKVLRLAQKQNEWFQLVKDGQLDPEQFMCWVQKFIDMPEDERDSVFQIPKNGNGHYAFTITGKDLSGREEMNIMNEEYFEVDPSARDMFVIDDGDNGNHMLAINPGDTYYDKRHRLKDGEKYHIVLVPGHELEEGQHTIAGVLKYADSFGYRVPHKAGIMPRIRERIVTARQMEQMGCNSIVCFHDPIMDTERNWLFFGISYLLGNIRFSAHYRTPYYVDKDTAFVFIN